jgi:tellurite resistance protein TehA-like permease
MRARLLLAILKTCGYLRDGMPFNLGCWGLTFPLGVYSLARLALAHETRLAFFSVVGSVLVVCLAVVWLIVAVLTIVGGWAGYLFRPASFVPRLAGRYIVLDPGPEASKRMRARLGAI